VHILSKEFRRLVVQGIIRIGFVKEVNESVNDGINVEHGLPILSQNVETNLSLQINVWMVNLGLTFYFWGRMGIVRGNGKGEMIGRRLPVARIGTHHHVKQSQVVGIRKGNRRHLATVQFRNICTVVLVGLFTRRRSK
jgi:hypothetical protein